MIKLQDHVCISNLAVHSKPGPLKTRGVTCFARPCFPLSFATHHQLPHLSVTKRKTHHNPQLQRAFCAGFCWIPEGRDLFLNLPRTLGLRCGLPHFPAFLTQFCPVLSVLAHICLQYPLIRLLADPRIVQIALSMRFERMAEHSSYIRAFRSRRPDTLFQSAVLATLLKNQDGVLGSQK